jgi:hypothetical protein
MGTQPLVPVVTFNPSVFLGLYPEFTAAYNRSVAPAGSATTVTAILGGTAGTYIPAGVLAVDVFGNIYQSTSSVTIGSNGTVVCQFDNVATGEIPCPAGALSIIYTPLTGWDTISNPAAGILGSFSMPWIFPSYFSQAGLYVNNTSLSVVQNTSTLSMLLYMLTAHIAFLAGQLSADGQARPVGRVSSATEGSVSATFEDVGPTPGTGAWFRQSQYGAAFWQATTCYRGMQYCPNPTQVEGFTGTRLGSGLIPGSGLGSL